MGTRGGTSEDRDGFAAFIAIALQLMPLIVVIENVPSILTAQYDSQVQPLLKKLRTAGYVLDAHTYSCDLYGVAQRRKRVVIMGIRTNEISRSAAVTNDDVSKINVLLDKVLPPPVCADAIPETDFWTQDEARHDQCVHLDTYIRRTRRMQSTLSLIHI